ncbi:transcriptional regulator [Paractinoplanes deccanensis]|uniref:Transcriptional regulator n=1 Tax=Paractinoplanes deccanensis TaxID=113561 RepID=A0ABQ3XZD8_9ACTN|nr:AAA family ATPase [Actinoplanes deccanensis]GID73111.1 transcriptional regulator [Actinoplanes deccanensis]
MIATPSPSGLVNRTDERARLTTIIERAPSGGTALLVEGDAGIGKTALARVTEAHARRLGFRVLTARGVQGTAPAGFGALHEMLHPILDGAASLPPRQRSALLVAFGAEDGPSADRMLISLATLSLLEESAAGRPLLVIVEDLHWLDRSSAEVVAFLARRLRPAPVVLLALTRTGGYPDDWSGSFPEVLPLAPLSAEHSAELLDRVAPGLGPRSRQRVLGACAGNPLALRELPAALRDHDLRGSGRLPLTERLERAFLSEVARLPEGARRVLGLAAAGEDATVEELVAAMGVLGLDRADLDRVEHTGLLRVTNGRLAFRHPLLGEAVLGASSSVARAQAHRALARVSADPTRVAWHRASATYGWDEDVAVALDEAARAAQRQGAHHEAMVAYRRAAELSPEPGRRVHRLAEAAEAARRAGLTAESAALLREAAPLAEAPAVVRALARTEWLLSMTSNVPGRGARELVWLAESGSDRPVEILLWAATKAYILEDPHDVREEVRAALELAPAAERDELLRQIGLALLDPRHGLSALHAELSAVLARLLDEQAEIVNVLAFAAETTQDFATAERCWTAAVDFHHESGRLSDEAVTLCGRGTMRLAAGAITDGLADSGQALRLSLDFDLPVVGAIAAATVALAHALQGDNAGAATALDQARRLLGAESFARVQAMTAWAEGVLALNEDRPADALTALEATAVNGPVHLWAGTDLVEAAVRAHKPEAARRWLAQAGQPPFPDRLAHTVERTKALLTPDARAHFEAAVDHGRRAGVPLDLGRTRLAYGEWLHRTHARAEAHHQLTEAATLLHAAGATRWAAIAETKIGVAHPHPDGGHRLTPQELQVARLAAANLTNREIADRVYIAPQAVADHLTRAFRKLGVTERAGLAPALDAQTGRAGSA